MWMFARCLAEIGQVAHTQAEFKTTVLLLTTETYAATGTAFQLRTGEHVHLTGETSAHPS